MTNVGQEFDDSRVSDPHVARSVIHFIKSQGMLTIAKTTDLVTVRLQAAFYDKKMFRQFQLVVFSPDLSLNPMSPDLIRDHLSFHRGYGWGSGLLGNVSLHDVSITNFYSKNIGLPNLGLTGIDVITFAGKGSGEYVPDWSDYANA